MAKGKSAANPKISRSNNEYEKQKKVIPIKKTVAGPKKSKTSTGDTSDTTWSRRQTRSGGGRSVPSESVEKGKSAALTDDEQSQVSAFLSKQLLEQNFDLGEFAKAIVRFQKEAQIKLNKRYRCDGKEDNFASHDNGSFVESEDDMEPDADADADADVVADEDEEPDAGEDAEAESDNDADAEEYKSPITMVGVRGDMRGVSNSSNPVPQIQFHFQAQSSHSVSEGGSYSQNANPSSQAFSPQSRDGDSGSYYRRKRGPTRNLKLARLRPGQKLPLQIFRNNIVGEHAQCFVTQCGVWVRENYYVPLQVKNFTCIPPEKKDRLWQLIQEKFEFLTDAPDVNAKKIAMSQIRKAFANYKSDMKRQYYNKYETDEERLQHPPPHVAIDDWEYLVHLWGTPEAKAMSEQNKINRSKVETSHTAGSCSYERKRYKMIQEGGEPDPVEFFKINHTRKDGSAVDNSAQEAMTKMQELRTKASEGLNLLTPEEIFQQVVQPKSHSRPPSKQDLQRQLAEEVQKKEQIQAQLQAQVQAEVAQAKLDMQAKMAEMQAQMLAHQAHMQLMMEQMSKQMLLTTQQAPRMEQMPKKMVLTTQQAPKKLPPKKHNPRKNL